MTESSAAKTRNIAIGLLVWLAIAATSVKAGVLARVRPPLLLVGLAALVIILCLTLPALRLWMRRADLRLFLLPHLVRFVGVIFLILIVKGVLSPAFTPIGWGDLGSALGALVLLLVGPPGARYSQRWWLWLVWSTFGLADMAFLVMTGIRAGTREPEQFAMFLELPFGLLPTFVVPLIIATHVLIFIRLFAQHPEPAT